MYIPVGSSLFCDVSFFTLLKFSVIFTFSHFLGILRMRQYHSCLLLLRESNCCKNEAKRHMIYCTNDTLCKLLYYYYYYSLLITPLIIRGEKDETKGAPYTKGILITLATLHEKLNSQIPRDHHDLQSAANQKANIQIKFIKGIEMKI